ncbi:DUF4189 domain-containing protein [Luteibacter yeojuensis]
MTNIGNFTFGIIIALAFTTHASAQCAPGIPSAGNPGCVPTNQPNSPYYQESGPTQPPAQAAVWADRWGAIAIDDNSGKGGTVSSAASKSNAESEAMQRCVDNGGIQCKLMITYRNQCVAASQKLTGGQIVAFRAATIT